MKRNLSRRLADVRNDLSEPSRFCDNGLKLQKFAVRRTIAVGQGSRLKFLSDWVEPFLTTKSERSSSDPDNRYDLELLPAVRLASLQYVHKSPQSNCASQQRQSDRKRRHPPDWCHEVSRGD